MASSTTVNIYRCNGVWCFAAFADDVFDVSDTLDVLDTDTALQARAAALDMYPGADVRKVDDIEI